MRATRCRHGGVFNLSYSRAGAIQKDERGEPSMMRRITTLILFVSMSTVLVGTFSPAGASAVTTADAVAALHSRTAGGAMGVASEVPGVSTLNAGGAAQVNALSCASPGNCGAGGVYMDAAGHQQVWVADQVNGTWNSAVEMPGTALLNAGTEADFNSISCPSSGSCTAVGDFTDQSGHLQAFVADEKSGTWGSALEQPGTGFLNVAGGAATLAVSCASAGNCSVGGFYGDASAHLESFAANEVSGSWNTATEVPGTSSLNVGTESALLWMSCASAGNCSATGNYTDSSAHFQSYVVDEQSGTWGAAIETPGDATLNTGGDMEYNSISCSSAGNCAAGGYYTDASAHKQAFDVNEANGVWGTAGELPGIATLNAGGESAIFAVSCKASGSCSAVGNYTDAATNVQAFAVDEQGGTWSNVQEVPGTATLNLGGVASLNDISCTAPGDCDAVGFYSDTATSAQAFYVDEVGGTWGSATEIPGIATLNASGGSTGLTTSCSTYGSCSVGGFYSDSTGNAQAFVVSETFAKATEKIHISVSQTTKTIKRKVTETGLKLSATGLGTATGSVVFSSNKGSLCTATITGGSAKCSSSKRFAKGTLSVTAKYAGDTFDQAASSTSKVAVK